MCILGVGKTLDLLHSQVGITARGGGDGDGVTLRSPFPLFHCGS